MVLACTEDDEVEEDGEDGIMMGSATEGPNRWRSVDLRAIRSVALLSSPAVVVIEESPGDLSRSRVLGRLGRG